MSKSKKFLNQFNEDPSSKYDKDFGKSMGIEIPNDWDLDPKEKTNDQAPKVQQRKIKASPVRIKTDSQLSDKTISDIRQMNKEAGGYWFSKETMEFYKSVVYKRVVKAGNVGWIFFSSENYAEGRKFQVRICTPDGDIKTLATKLFDLEDAKDWVKENISKIVSGEIRPGY